MKFILWSPDLAPPRPDDDGKINTSGVFGQIDENNVYLTSYPENLDRTALLALEVGGCVRGIRYSLSGTRGVYDIYRVE